MKLIIVSLLGIIMVSCQGSKPSSLADTVLPKPSEVALASLAQPEIPSNTLPDSAFVNLRDYTNDIIYDLKYAGSDNFLKSQIYDCPECYLRLKTVRALMQASEEFDRRGYRIKLFDCYRPLSVQKQMWKIVNNPKYVADPAKGSIHNRGGAVDITLTDKHGTEVDMGTGFDHFDKEASHGYTALPEEILANRRLLRTVMEKNGFSALESEWWHYNLAGSTQYPVSDFNWPCH